MSARTSAIVPTILQRLKACYAGRDCDWSKFFSPKYERGNFATRYHLVYPALAFYLLMRRDCTLKSTLRPLLDTIYRGLLEPRTWRYWHDELNETTWPLKERNLTFAGRLATFVGFYIDAFGEPPAPRIEFGGVSTSYSELSTSLWWQMGTSESCGVSCYHHQAMVMCNAHLLINNILHDRLFATSFAAQNVGWLQTVSQHLLRYAPEGSIFFYGTKPNAAHPAIESQSVGADIWALFLMSAVAPEQIRVWFDRWRRNIEYRDGKICVPVSEREVRNEMSSPQLAAAWAFCLTRELGERTLADALRQSLIDQALHGFELDPLLSGLCLLGESLDPGAFRRLVIDAA